MAMPVADVVEREALQAIEVQRKPVVVRVLAWVVVIPLVMLGAAAITGAVLHLTGHLRAATVISGSMEPGIPVGSLVLGWADEPALGGVVMAHREDGTFVTHRVIELLPDGDFRMKGDANLAPDALTYDGDSWAVFAQLPYVGEAFQWVIHEPLALIGAGALAGIVLAGALRPSCRGCRSLQECTANA